MPLTYHRHSFGAYLASSVGVALNVMPVGTVAFLARQRQATADCSGMLNSAVASGSALAALVVPVNGTSNKVPLPAFFCVVMVMMPLAGLMAMLLMLAVAAGDVYPAA